MWESRPASRTPSGRSTGTSGWTGTPPETAPQSKTASRNTSPGQRSLWSTPRPTTTRTETPATDRESSGWRRSPEMDRTRVQTAVTSAGISPTSRSSTTSATRCTTRCTSTTSTPSSRPGSPQPATRDSFATMSSKKRPTRTSVRSSKPTVQRLRPSPASSRSLPTRSSTVPMPAWWASSSSTRKQMSKSTALPEGPS